MTKVHLLWRRSGRVSFSSTGHSTNWGYGEVTLWWGYGEVMVRWGYGEVIARFWWGEVMVRWDYGEVLARLWWGLWWGKGLLYIMDEECYNPSRFPTWCIVSVFATEPRHDKTNKVTMRPAKTQISLGIRSVWSESSLCAYWVAKDPKFLHADSEDSDQTARMPRLIWVFAGRICHFAGFVMSRLNCIS